MRTRGWQFRFFWASVAALVGSTIAWSWMSARLQLGNSDQLVDGFLFRNLHTFHEALFPSTHTQLIKWPLFVLIHLFHFSPQIYLILTVLLVLVTVAGFAYILYRIGRPRLTVVSTLYLMLAVVLLMVPAQVSGVTSPLNMALLTGRNVEYLIYIGYLALLVRMPRYRSWHAFVAVLVLSLLMASDQLFLYYGLLAAGLTVLLALVVGHVQLRRVAIKWLFTSLSGAVCAELLLIAIGHGATHIVDAPAGYTRIHTLYGFVQGIQGAVEALGINFGLTSRMGWFGVLGYLISICVVLAVAWAAIRMMRSLISGRQPLLDTPEIMSILLIMTTVVAAITFALQSQPYLDNARYLGIGVFADFTVLGTQLRKIELHIRQVYSAATILIVAVVLATIGGLRYTDTMIAKSPLEQRDRAVAQSLAVHHVSYLVGNYWRVFPISMQTPMASQAASPLSSCLNPTMLLTSEAWQPDLRLHSFAYLLTSDSVGLPTVPCQKYFVESQYGPPTSIAVVAGTSHTPKEELLFYDNGASDRLQIHP